MGHNHRITTANAVGHVELSNARIQFALHFIDCTDLLTCFSFNKAAKSLMFLAKLIKIVDNSADA